MKKFFVVMAILGVCSASSVSCSFQSRESNANTNTNANASVEAETAGTPSAAGGESAAVAAAALVADLYKQHDAKKSPFFQTKNRGLVDRFFTKRLGDLIWKDANDSSGEVGAISADPLYNAQDIEIKNFGVGTAVVKNETATVPVTFTNFGAKQTVTFNLKQTGSAWKIDDINYGSGDSLMKWVKEIDGEKPSSTSGEFEGRYQVGETTCTVKPVKMAFEIKWAKGKGAEYFFYKDANVFESEEDKSGGRNEFRFDDENYNSGTFVRADGKSFAVSRAK